LAYHKRHPFSGAGQIRAVRLGDAFTGIAHKLLRCLHLGLEVGQRCNVICGDAHHRCAEFLEVRQPGGVGFRLGVSAGGECFGEEIQHHRVLGKRVFEIKRHRLAAEHRLSSELWCGVARVKCGSTTDIEQRHHSHEGDCDPVP